MKTHNKTPLTRIQEILSEIKTYAAEKNPDRKTELAIAQLLENVGREAIHLTPAFREKHGHIPWQEVINMQHQAIDSVQLWKMVKEDVPNLYDKVSEILKLEGV